MTVQLRCVDKDHRGQVWTLELDPERVVLRDSAATVVREFTSEEAVKQFQMPSFSESIKYFGIRLDGKVRSFDMSKEEMKRIKDFRNCVTALAGPVAVTSVRNKAIRDTLIGIALAIGGVALTVGSIVAAAAKPEGRQYSITYGLVIFGLIMLGKGIHGFVQYGRLKPLLSKLHPEP